MALGSFCLLFYVYIEIPYAEFDAYRTPRDILGVSTFSYLPYFIIVFNDQDNRFFISL